MAERLARHPDVPISVLRLLAKDLIEIAAPILKRTPVLSEFDWLAIMAATGTAHHRVIASRADLSPAIVAALRLTGDPETLQLVAHYPPTPTRVVGEPGPAPSSESLGAPAPERFVPASDTPIAKVEQPSPIAPAPQTQTLLAAAPAIAEAREVYSVARAMTAALGHEMQSLASREIPLPASKPATETITAGSNRAKPAPVAPPKATPPAAPAPTVSVMPPEPAAPGEKSAETLPDMEAFLALDPPGRLAVLLRLSGSAPAPSRHSAAIDADHAFRAALSGARVTLLARQKQRDQLITALSTGLRLDRDAVTALMDDPSGEALVILLKAIGLDDAEAQQVLLFANPAISAAVETFGRLAELHAGADRSAASRLVDFWRHGAEPARRGHQPLFADMELRRDTRPEAERRAAEPLAERATGALRGS
ncbi:DUF2336 domain-containing protein [Kaistia dalseonensis]|uniref:DUF2336 domain-containing protein n=1 Tax=Kaistia dalseonensis TaxID=410840 RepID=A0ABU0HE77_9HYPH|nr:DUF2336 domain-containing protein [Kaistia dalseonensis]MCX5497620.1 DUF2336 domain-containing protein [Kaistia dalseonensis]MDQ0440262.1 hypothetical protein [Kaistia dalseonensis]